MKRFANGVVLILLLLVPGRLHATESGGGLDLAVDREEVGIDLGFHGATVRASAAVPGDAVTVFLLVGPEESIRLKIKDRVAGVLWANVDEIEFDHVRTLLLAHVHPANPSVEILEAAGLTDEAIERRMLPADASPEARSAFLEMLKLLRREHRLVVGGDARRNAEGRVETDFRLPAGTPVGDYRVEVVAFRGDRRIGAESAPLTVRKVGLVAAVSRLAVEHGFWYGTVAVVVAVVVGLLTGFVFGRGRLAAH